jgi:putative flavoprotein involved in K+ transport
VLDERHDDVDDITRARNVPSPQLIGSRERTSLDLNVLRQRGIRIVGRLGGIVDGAAQLSGSLANVCALADLKMARLLRRLDDWAVAAGLDADLEPPQQFEATRIDPKPLLQLDLSSGQIRTIVWATGYRPDHSWLDIPVLDRSGRIRHDGGVVSDVPGLYLLGMPFLRRRASTFIHGADGDTEELGAHLHTFLGGADPDTSQPRRRGTPAQAVVYDPPPPRHRPSVPGEPLGRP